MTDSDQNDISLTRREFVMGTVLSGTASLLGAADEKPSAQPSLAGTDWPMYRHDPELSAESPIRGRLGGPPRVTWSI